MPIALTYEEVKALEPCPDAFEQATKLLGGEGWGGREIDAAAAREAGCTLGDIVWVASALARKDADVRRRLQLWMADCAARVLHVYEQSEASGAPRKAIIAARQYARGEIDNTACTAASHAAWAAFGDAESAAWAAAWAPSMSAAKDASRAAVRSGWTDAASDVASDAAWAAGWAAASDAEWDAASDAARSAEEDWQFTHLIERLSDNEPEDWPLPKRPVVAAA